MKLAKVLSGLGRSMITLGVLILLFVAYQLWGTGIREAQAQDRLKSQFNKQLEAQVDAGDSATVGGSSTTTSSSASGDPASSAPPQTTPPSTAPSIPAPNEGDPVGKIEIPKIGLSAYVVEGVGVDDLKNGPGHYPDTPLPGQKGNASIAGHRTTYGAPFASIDELAVGDPITITTVQGTFTYTVMPVSLTDGNVGERTIQETQGGDPHVIVSPSDVGVLQPDPDPDLATLTLTACHPKYSASQRIVVRAKLQGIPLPATPKPVTTTAAAAAPSLSLSGPKAPKLPAVLFGVLCAAIWFAAWFIGRRWRKWPAYLIGLPFFLIALFYFFENFSRLLPANY